MGIQQVLGSMGSLELSPLIKFQSLICTSIPSTKRHKAQGYWAWAIPCCILPSVTVALKQGNDRQGSEGSWSREQLPEMPVTPDLGCHLKAIIWLLRDNSLQLQQSSPLPHPFPFPSPLSPSIELECHCHICERSSNFPSV